MAARGDKELIYEKIREYLQCLRDGRVPVWRIYLYGSCARDTHTPDSDIDLAIFLEKDELDGFEEDALLMKLRRKVDLRIEPHAFARSDFDTTNPHVREILASGERIL